MEFWSRLIGGAALTPSKSIQKNVTAKRLTTFKRTCSNLYQIWRSAHTLSPDSPTILLIHSLLDRLNSILSDESRGPSPHPCHVDAATSQVYLTVTKLALTTNDPGIISSSARLFNTLIEAEVDGIVDSRVFSRALVELVSRGNTGGDNHNIHHDDDDDGGGIGGGGEAKLVELVFGVANIIRLRPEVLPAWFLPQEQDDGQTAGLQGKEEFAGATRRGDFPLFYLLVDYVHCEGRTGDFARTGLLYIIETASKAKDLEKWLIESDMATLMATGLGASYSQLSRVTVSNESHEAPPIVSFSDDMNAESSVQPHGAQLDAFLSYLLFWQDAIDHCKSAEVNDTLLDHFQVLFLEQLLYPSLLESSDVDGGSTSSVITYLCRILESVDHPDLVHRILHFLLASPSNEEPQVLSPEEKAQMSLSRRKSLDLLASFTEAAPKPSPTLFNLVDLVLMGIRSRNRQTVVATLRLITVILQHHHQFASSLIKMVGERGIDASYRTVGALNTELEHLLGMATAVIKSPSVDKSYGEYIDSASTILYHRTHSLPSTHDHQPFPESPWILNFKDEIFSGMLDLLRQFYTNSVITNLALTNAVAALASSDLISLDGWLLVLPQKYQFAATTPTTTTATTVKESPDAFTSEEPEEPQDKKEPLQSLYDRPTWSSDDTPVLSEVLTQLVQQMDVWRKEIADFDVLLEARREILHREDIEQPASSRRLTPNQTGTGEAYNQDSNSNSTPASPPLSERLKIGSIMSDMGLAASATAMGSPSQQMSSPPSRSQSKTRGSRPVVKDLRQQVVASRVSEPFVTLSQDVEGGGGSDSPNNPIPDATVDRGRDDGKGGEEEEEGDGDDKKDQVSVNHIITNAVILYEFILEISALVQARASILQDVRFD